MNNAAFIKRHRQCTQYKKMPQFKEPDIKWQDSKAKKLVLQYLREKKIPLSSEEKNDEGKRIGWSWSTLHSAFLQEGRASFFFVALFVVGNVDLWAKIIVGQKKQDWRCSSCTSKFVEVMAVCCSGAHLTNGSRIKSVLLGLLVPTCFYLSLLVFTSPYLLLLVATCFYLFSSFLLSYPQIVVIPDSVPLFSRESQTTARSRATTFCRMGQVPGASEEFQ